MNKKIIDRINKLMAMANDKSATNEAQTAAEMALKLMEENGISTKDLDSAKLEDDLGEIGQTVLKGRRNMATWEKQLALVIANRFGCVAFTNKKGYKGNWWFSTGFVGHEANRITCETMNEWLRKAIQREGWKKYSYSSAMYNSFCIGAVQAIMDKYNDLSKKTDSEIEYGLVVYDEVRNWVDQNMNMKTSKLRCPSVYSSAYASGKQMGSGLSLNKQFGLKQIASR